ncbi:MAG: hypothetical protein K6U09_11570 [Acidobacteriia bacterium]|jgi:drug/metabolite transporter (DMT)-like permease|nr:hypothetical protein [Terriglobia bacterium]
MLRALLMIFVPAAAVGSVYYAFGLRPPLERLAGVLAIGAAVALLVWRKQRRATANRPR